MDLLRTAVARFLEKKEYWGDEQAIYSRMDESLNKFQATEYSFYCSDELEQSIIYVPSAFQFIYEMRPRYDHVCEVVATFVSGWCKPLESIEIYSPLCDVYRDILDAWVATFSPPVDPSGHRDALEEVVDAAAPMPVIALLDSLLEARVKLESSGSELLHHDLLCHWGQRRRSPPASANLIALFMKTRLFPDSSRIFRDEVVLRNAFDAALCKAHWHLCKKLVRRKVGKAFVMAVHKTLFNRT